MINRAADYKQKNDIARLEACESVNKDLIKLIAIYGSTNIKPPTEKELKGIPYGDLYDWLKFNDTTFR